MSNQRPEFCRDDHLQYLNDLRDSGVTNMWGAASYVQNNFKDELTRDQAKAVTVYWMRSVSA